MTANERSRPRWPTGAAHSSTLNTHSEPTAAPEVLRLTQAERDAIRPLYVLIVKTEAERVTRRVYLSLPAAVKATQRAQARGHAASLELHRILPHEAVVTDA